ncbi:uncharacterized protein SETTUDRAFT_155840 [Exserohilum turcica Et28A]|uniref:SRR1-like domain-containing protein n=1 Tax=Exserohilum turcicum (strain 28A) TaxID=671987 RepID=R0K0S7_EXST2|nr:uncharacterized protein SETTUDRAFT_155840 [Exserohilum turcica Et28A]EOA83289.1 hypothetical protein SETTUDRAFT_155840 [Exserohilum turcica Et28A]
MGGRSRGRVKRKQIQSDDGWTVIAHGLANVSLGSSEQKEKQGSLPDMVQDLTTEKLLAEFKMLQERWEDTALAAQVKQIVEEKSKDGEGGCGWGVTEAVCIGIGSFSRDWAHRWRSLWQLVLFVDVVGCLTKETTNKQIPCYAQDPAFTPLDTEFLSLLSITSLSSHLESKITASSFVYSPFVDWFLLLPKFLAGRDPVLYVGNEILDDYAMYAQTRAKRERLDECNEVGRRWAVAREMLRLKEFEKHANALNGMVVYWRVAETTMWSEKPSHETDH